MWVALFYRAPLLFFVSPVEEQVFTVRYCVFFFLFLSKLAEKLYKLAALGLSKSACHRLSWKRCIQNLLICQRLLSFTKYHFALLRKNCTCDQCLFSRLLALPKVSSLVFCSVVINLSYYEVFGEFAE